MQPLLAHLLQPCGDELVGLVPAVAVMVAAADHELGLATDAGEVLHHHDDLNIEVAMTGGVQQISGNDDQIVAVGDPQEPVELPEAVVEIRDDQGFHGTCLGEGLRSCSTIRPNAARIKLVGQHR